MKQLNVTEGDIQGREALIWIIHLLQSKNIPYQISGGLAAKIYGSRRPLNDIDLDVPREYIDVIASATENYIVYGPTQHKDEKWDLYVLTLDYFGQEIDIGEDINTKIYDDAKEEWVSAATDISKAVTKTYWGMDVQVMNPHELVTYKKLLNGTHQITDIEAVTSYIRTSET